MFSYVFVQKWVSDGLIQEAGSQLGIPCTIFRPGTISGHSKTGHSNRNDFMNRVLCGIAQLGSCPAVKASINFAPVDYVAASIVHIR